MSAKEELLKEETQQSVDILHERCGHEYTGLVKPATEKVSSLCLIYQSISGKISEDREAISVRNET